MDKTSIGMTQSQARQGSVTVDRSDSALMLRFSGRWHLSRNLPSASLVFPELVKPPVPRSLGFDTSELSGWDSGLVSFLLEVESACRERGIKEDREGLPAGLKRLLELAEAVPEKEGARAAA